MTCTADDLKLLFAEFPREDIHWRAQTVSKTGDKALALAYLDARDVMDRLDQVCGAANWQDRYEFDGPRTVCYLSIRIDGEWITKADGAGDTQVEAEKGAISDALKRAAVKWGIGRYLYSLGNTWVPCQAKKETGRDGRSKWVFTRFTADPWEFVRHPNFPPPKSVLALKRSDRNGDDAWARLERDLIADFLDCTTIPQLEKLRVQYRERMDKERWATEWRKAVAGIFKTKQDELEKDEQQYEQTVLEAG